MQQPSSIRYIRVLWHHNLPEEPVVLISELDENRLEKRKLHIYANGRVAWADVDQYSADCELGYEPVPSNTQIGSDPQFEVTDITPAEFEHHWAMRERYDLTFMPTKIPLAPFWRRSWDHSIDDLAWSDSVMCATFDGFIIDLNGQINGGPPFSLPVTGPRAIDRFEPLFFEESQSQNDLIKLATEWSYKLVALDLVSVWRTALHDELSDLLKNLWHFGEVKSAERTTMLLERLNAKDPTVFDDISILCTGENSLAQLHVTKFDHKRLNKQQRFSWNQHLQAQTESLVHMVECIRRHMDDSTKTALVSPPNENLHPK